MSLCLQVQRGEHNTNAAQAFMPSQSLCLHQDKKDRFGGVFYFVAQDENDSKS